MHENDQEIAAELARLREEWQRLQQWRHRLDAECAEWRECLKAEEADLRANLSAVNRPMGSDDG